MKNINIIKAFSWLVVIMTLLITGCNSFDEPELINNPDQTYTLDPAITSVFPADSAIAGVREIIISGENFAVNGIDTNWIFIGGEPVVTKSITANEIVVHRPNTSGEDISITVVVPSALNIAQVLNYKIEAPVEEFGDFSRENYDLMSIEVDMEENLYVATRRKIMKLTPDGINLTELGTYGSAFAKITNMKFGPDGLLYVAISKREIYTVNPITGEEIEFISLSSTTERLDFDINGNLYTGRRNGINVVRTDKSITETELYDGTQLKELRVYEGYLYVATAKLLSRHQILDAAGSLGAVEEIYNLATSDDFSTCELNSFNISIDGEFYLCLSNHPDYTLFVLEESNNLIPYYNNIDILPNTIDQIIWGNGRYLYLNRGISLTRDDVRLYRMGMEGLGAPYIGR